MRVYYFTTGHTKFDAYNEIPLSSIVSIHPIIFHTHEESRYNPIQISLPQ